MVTYESKYGKDLAEPRPLEWLAALVPIYRTEGRRQFIIMDAIVMQQGAD